MQVQSLQVLVARGFAHFDEGNDVGVVRVQNSVEPRRVEPCSGEVAAPGLEVRITPTLFVGVADAHVNAHAAPAMERRFTSLSVSTRPSALSAM